MINKTGKTRALLALGIHSAIVLATDNPHLDWEIRNIPSDGVDDVLGDWLLKDKPPGLYLFEGEGTWTVWQGSDGTSEPELEWEGSVRPVVGAELESLLAMEPTEEETL